MAGLDCICLQEFVDFVVNNLVSLLGNLLLFCQTRGYFGTMFSQCFSIEGSNLGISLWDQVNTSLFFWRNCINSFFSSLVNRVPTSTFLSRSFSSKEISSSSSMVIFGSSTSSSTLFRYVGKYLFNCYSSASSGTSSSSFTFLFSEHLICSSDSLFTFPPYSKLKTSSLPFCQLYTFHLEIGILGLGAGSILHLLSSGSTLNLDCIYC